MRNAISVVTRFMLDLRLLITGSRVRVPDGSLNSPSKSSTCSVGMVDTVSGKSEFVSKMCQNLIVAVIVDAVDAQVGTIGLGTHLSDALMQCWIFLNSRTGQPVFFLLILAFLIAFLIGSKELYDWATKTRSSTGGSSWLVWVLLFALFLFGALVSGWAGPLDGTATLLVRWQKNQRG